MKYGKRGMIYARRAVGKGYQYGGIWSWMSAEKVVCGWCVGAAKWSAKGRLVKRPCERVLMDGLQWRVQWEGTVVEKGR